MRIVHRSKGWRAFFGKVPVERVGTGGLQEKRQKKCVCVCNQGIECGFEHSCRFLEGKKYM